MQDGKPEVQTDGTAPAGTEAQQKQEQPANPSVEVSDSVKSYLKGLGMENVQATPELVKLAEAGMKQKESVSKLSFEKENLLARLASQGKDTSEPEFTQEEEETKPATTSAPAPQDDAKHNVIGVSDNDLFDLSRMIVTEFPEIKDQAQDGSLFKELRQLGYFTSEGINKKAVYDYLAGKNAQAQELRELREFKKKYENPDPNANPVYNPQMNLNLDGDMTKELAHAIVLHGDTSNKRYNEALSFLRNDAAKVRK